MRGTYPREVLEDNASNRNVQLVSNLEVIEARRCGFLKGDHHVAPTSPSSTKKAAISETLMIRFTAVDSVEANRGRGILKNGYERGAGVNR